MKHTEHCQKRMKQRGKSALDIRVIEKYGEHRRGGICMLSVRRAKAIIVRLRKRLARLKKSSSFNQRSYQLRQIIDSVERTTNWMMISAGDTAITLYPADKKRQKKFMRGQCRPCV